MIATSGRMFAAAHLSLGRGDVEAASAGLEARGIFERLRATPWLERVDAIERAVTV